MQDANLALDLRSDLLKAPLFSGIESRADLRRLAALAHRKTYASGDMVHACGPVAEIAIIVRGAVAVRLEQGIEPLCLGVGSTIGEMEFFHPDPVSVSLVAVQDTELICLRFEDLREVVRQNPCTGVQIYGGFMKTMVEKLRKVNDSLVEVSQRSDARHLAHDLRGPIAALQAMGSSISTLSDRDRSTFDMVVARMDSIAASAGPAAGVVAKPLSARLDALLEEKRVQYAVRTEVAFERAEPVQFGQFRGDVDAVALLRVVSNLLDNGAQALPSGGPGRVTVSTYEAPGILRLDVADTGRGIPHRVLKELGTRPVTHDKDGGQGIGVFHAFRLLESAGGQMVICSSPGAGTIVSLRLYAA